mgnify:FL=1|jgi:hypothetical protein|tara:strand:- start:580 stop:927 length:348 start_codon:yes stop_codon:yes gene_type:complete
MPILKKEFEIGTKKIWVRQASGMERLKFETLLAKTFRKFKHFGLNQDEWTDEQQEEFMVALEDVGGDVNSQITEMIPPCLPDDFDVNMLDKDELMQVFNFVRGIGEPEGAIPLDS